MRPAVFVGLLLLVGCKRAAPQMAIAENRDAAAASPESAPRAVSSATPASGDSGLEDIEFGGVVCAAGCNPRAFHALVGLSRAVPVAVLRESSVTVCRNRHCVSTRLSNLFGPHNCVFAWRPPPLTLRANDRDIAVVISLCDGDRRGLEVAFEDAHNPDLHDGDACL